MMLNCPSCGSRFLVDPGHIAPKGRKVRCGNCGHSWRQMPQAAVAEAGEAAMTITRLDEFDEARRRAAARRGPALPEPPRSPGMMIGWSLLVLLVILLVAGAWFERERIMVLVPETTRLYALVGLAGPPPPAVGEGLELRDVTSVRRLVDGQRTLLIEGSVVNVTDQPLGVPTMRAVLTDPQGQEITHWTFTAEGSDLPPGGITTFQTSTEDPPREGNLSLIFVEVE